MTRAVATVRAVEVDGQVLDLEEVTRLVRVARRVERARQPSLPTLDGGAPAPRGVAIEWARANARGAFKRAVRR